MTVMISISRIMVLTVILGLSCSCDSNSNSSRNSVSQQLTGSIRVQAQPFRLQVVVAGKVLVQQCGPIQISRADGSVDELLALVSEREEGNVTIYDVDTKTGEPVSLSVPTMDGSSLRISLAGSNMTAVSVGLCLESGELIYGLTERLGDSAILIPATNGPMVEDFNPDSQGFHRFVWDSDQLPNITATLDSLRSRGFRLAVWSAAWARNNGPDSNGAEAAALGYLAPGNSRVIDLTSV